MAEHISVEIEGSTIEDAVKKALRELKVSRDRVKIEVLSEEKKGLFGMAGAKLAKIRVTITG
jgi:spoIIIJ-associated protein